MDITEIGKKLGLSESKLVICKAAELHRLCDIQFDCSAIGIGETCKAVICLEIPATRYQSMCTKFTFLVLFDSFLLSREVYLNLREAYGTGLPGSIKDLD
ncbi:hypothetical protein Vadar_001951 [Vaccinium darrowii]|uniref:Uncharacterized protein n=1 Tax=Vaccinium darrowii TaxID=229202 RepID=A0ACB7XMK2_9ERIC|nr:hypothetical protein Vadar_001951 [Vaccinium darrowii]